MLSGPHLSATRLRQAPARRFPTIGSSLLAGLLQLGTADGGERGDQTLARATGATASDPQAEWLLSRAWLQEGNLKEATAALSRAGSYRSETHA